MDRHFVRCFRGKSIARMPGLRTLWLLFASPSANKKTTRIKIRKKKKTPRIWGKRRTHIAHSADRYQKTLKQNGLPWVGVLRCMTGELFRWSCSSGGGSRMSRYLDTIRTEMKYTMASERNWACLVSSWNMRFFRLNLLAVLCSFPVGDLGAKGNRTQNSSGCLCVRVCYE